MLIYRNYRDVNQNYFTVSGIGKTIDEENIDNKLSL
ncbi:MAG: hypothetical protein QG657_4145 [Acidobacteriota bacterium]|nr:hypothetical protein [Acidobacteriota bacterium]